MPASIFDMPVDDLRERAAVVQQMIEVVRDALPTLEPAPFARAGAASPARAGRPPSTDPGELVDLVRACFDRLPQILPGMRRLSPGERRRFHQSRPDLEAMRARVSTGSVRVAVRAGETQGEAVERTAILERVSTMVRELTAALERARAIAAAPSLPPAPTARR